MDESCMSIDTIYGCLMMNGRAIVATKSWWHLNSTETYLINLLSLTLNDSTSRDIPIYLPFKNPQVFYE
jgi:hypothetical protein